MNEKVKKHLIDYCTKKGWGTTNEDLIETITEGKEVHREIIGSHRWYDDTFVVVEVDGMLICYNGYHITGDNGMDDMGLEYDINSFKEAVKKQKTIDYYEPIED